jgi:hypothetical protein
MLAGFPNIWWIIGVIIIVVGGNLAITAAWGYKHFAWGFPLVLAVLVVVTLEGSWQTELADRSALTAERNAHLGTMAALEAERQSPVSPGHRDRLKSLVRKLEEQISGAWPCRYFDHSDPRSNVRDMLASHFPEQVRALDIWDEAIGEQDAASADLLGIINEFVSENLSSAPWEPEAINNACQERLFILDHLEGPRTPEFKPNLRVEDGKLTWRVIKWESPTLHTVSPFEIASNDGEECRKVFESAFSDILESPELERLKAAWQTAREVRLETLDALRRIEQSDEIYRRCSECRHP